MKNLVLSNYNFRVGHHKGKSVIWIFYDPTHYSIQPLRTILPIKYSATKKAWYILDDNNSRRKVGLSLLEFPSSLQLKHVDAFNRYIETLKLKSYSPSTIKTYGNEFCAFMNKFNHHHPEKISPEQIRRYILYCAVELKLSEFTINSRMNAIKFYYEQVLHQNRIFFDVPRPKKPSVLPKVLSVNEVRDILNHTKNFKHKMILKTIYGMGLRVSEVVNLKIEDIDSYVMLVHIKGAKGKKDRIVVLPESLLDDLRKYYKMYKPKVYLFENRFGEKMHVRSVQSIFKKGLEASNSWKNVGVHSLRHSFATHLLENGTDVTLIQQLLGHNNIKTTLTYTHVSRKNILKVKSPLDNL